MPKDSKPKKGKKKSVNKMIVKPLSYGGYAKGK
jgi:hypothetical protein